jgi:hypothetical protein
MASEVQVLVKEYAEVEVKVKFQSNDVVLDRKATSSEMLMQNAGINIYEYTGCIISQDDCISL